MCVCVCMSMFVCIRDGRTAYLQHFQIPLQTLSEVHATVRACKMGVGGRCEHFGSVQSRVDLPVDLCLLVGACSRAFVLCARARTLSTLLSWVVCLL